MNRRISLSVLMLAVLLVMLNPVSAATTTLVPGYDEGNGFAGLGGGWDDHPGSGWCDVFMNAVGLNSEVYCWIGSDITFTSAKQVSMNANLVLKGYLETSNYFSQGIIRVYLECRNKDTEALVWSVQVWSDTRSGGEDYSYNNISLSLLLGSFPKSTATGTYYFCARISFVGCWGAYFCWSSSQTSTRARLYVNSITVTY